MRTPKLRPFQSLARVQVVVKNGAITHLFNGVQSSQDPSTFNMVTEVCQTGPPLLDSGVPVCAP
jgi:hypothetical protein|eukprot:m.393337 g.393337  ORF g.393337 m.393337 type:complete len:64 (-) comp28331_c0_seq10:2776-2967(-)